MSTTAAGALPIVDISGLRDGTEADLVRIADELGAVARDVGFCYLAGTGIPEVTFEHLLEVTKSFFALPTDVKMRSYIGRSRCHRGYVPPGEEVTYDGTVDRKEAFDTALDLPADDPDYLAGNPMLGPNLWPEIDGFAEAVTDYYTRAMDVGRLLFRALALALAESPDFFDAITTRTPSQLRLVHYPVDETAVDSVGFGAHTDFECFTLLKPTAPGLEVMSAHGVWVDAPPIDGTLVMNIGDMLETWTNGHFVATSHRVRKVAEERYSFPLFVNVDYDTVVEPLVQFVQPGDPIRR
ncbi:MAG TPA: 2-oxoglutarate and iron-dependent oxygenase domain-containing protein, partial [Acidimicrobiales bacterium]